MTNLLPAAPPPETRDDEGRWDGERVSQVGRRTDFRRALEAAVQALSTAGPSRRQLSDATLNLWAHEVVPGVRGAMAKR